MDALNVRVAALDFETTGLDPDRDWPVSVAVVTAPSAARARTQWRLAYKATIRTPVPVPPEATAVHGITTEMTQASGARAPEAVARDVVAALRGHVLVAHYLPFDWLFLRRIVPGAWTMPDPSGICTWTLAGLAAPGRSRALAAVADRYDVHLERAHDATHDAVATLQLVAPLVRALRLSDLRQPLATVDDLALLCAEHGPRAEGAERRMWSRILTERQA